jgi:hypothetical protein
MFMAKSLQAYLQLKMFCDNEYDYDNDNDNDSERPPAAAIGCSLKILALPAVIWKTLPVLIPVVKGFSRPVRTGELKRQGFAPVCIRRIRMEMTYV